MDSKPFSSRSIVIIAIITLFIAQTTVAQYSRSRSENKNTWEFGLSGGVSQFQTSINPNSDATFKKFNYWNADYNAAISVSIIKNFSPKFSAEFEFLTTKLSGVWNENNGYGIPLPATALKLPTPFETGINQFVLMLVPNLNKIVAPSSSNEKWYLFAKVGGGVETLKELKPALFSYDKNSGVKFTLAYGGGLSYTINEKIKIKLGTMWYRVETDRLDGIHTSKPGIVVLTKNEDLVYNVKERYFYPYIGMTYGFGQIQSKAHFIRGNNTKFLWFKPSTRKFGKKR